MRRRRGCRLLLAGAVATLLAACGKKGDLEPPPEEPAPAEPPPP